MRGRASTTRRAAIGVVVLTVAVGALAPVVATGPAGAAAADTPASAQALDRTVRCLTDHHPVDVVRGFRTDRFTSDVPADSAVDALGALWLQIATYPVSFGGGAGGCWLGGRIVGTYPQSTPWSTFHHTTGFAFTNPHFTVTGPRVHNIGDGIGVRTGAKDFAITDAHLSFIHDDCVQDDELYTGVVQHSLLDGCYVGFSARPTKGDSANGAGNTITIRNNLVRLQPMPTVYKGRAPGTGGFFKWDEHGRGPKLVIRDNVFRADRRPNHQTLGLPTGYPLACSNNVVVWLGRGRYPDKLPKCFTVTRDRAVWDRAVADWQAAHPFNL